MLFSIVAVLYVLGFFFDPVYLLAKIALGLLALFFVTDFIMLHLTSGKTVWITRELPDRFSNGDENTVEIFVNNRYPFPVNITILDEVPDQFQMRSFKIRVHLKAYEEKRLSYTLVPKKRGTYIFGKTNVEFTSILGLVSRIIKHGEKEVPVAVYPSFLKMRKYELLAISNRLSEVGVKRVRRIGTHTEFDQIKDYVTGDNYRTVNWKATAKRGRLMVNQYQDERSQNVYNIIDMGRTMRMPFNGMSLLDYAINASLIISNTALQKHDKAGLITFNKTIETFLAAERRNETLNKLLDRLYKQETEFYESDFSLLAAVVKRKVSHRSLFVIYTNFETLSSLKRHMSSFKLLARNHVLVVVIFENEEIEALSHEDVKTLEDLYIKTIAEKHIYDKKLIVKELMKHGIYSVLTKPENLTANLINKYLELKDTGRF